MQRSIPNAPQLQDPDRTDLYRIEMDPHDFIHLNSMQELADWNPESSFQHSPNISNTPLHFRPVATPPSSSSSEIPKESSISRLLVCHDYKGGYHPSESSQGRCPFSETAYTAEYLQYISTFVYFSHKRVAIPPASWINLMHRNGVKVLGTFIIEGDEGSTEMGRVLEKGSEGEFLFATQLARISETYGFDGWLLNFESSFPDGKFSPFQLQQFLRELKSATATLVPGSEIIWYDALTILNQVHWQNGLTLLNVPFFAATDGIFTNYGWRESQLHNTSLMSRVISRPSEVYTGIDCFGRGSLGDGGFGVGTALKEICKEGLSAALFAPGWTFENFDGQDFHSVDRKFWVGDETSLAEPGPVSEYCRIRESGTEHYFYTNFNRGFGKALFLKGERVLGMPWVHIGTQSIVPSFYPQSKDVIKWVYSNKTAYMGAWSLGIFATPPRHPHGGTHSEYSCPLYKLGVKVTRDLVLKFTYQLPEDTGETTGLYCDIAFGWQTEKEKIKRYTYNIKDATPTEELDGWITAHTSILRDEKDVPECRVIELGISYQPPIATPRIGRSITIDISGVPTRIATFGELLLTTLDTGAENQPSLISKIIPSETAAGKLKLAWNVYPTYGSDAVQAKRDRGMWSKLTKDFAWFVVWKWTRFVGVSYCLEFIVDAEGMGMGGWRVDGVTWEGAVFAGP